MTRKKWLLEPPESLTSLVRDLFKPIRAHVHDRDTRSPELVEYLKDRAEEKRQRRRYRNLRHVMSGGYQP